MLAHTCIKPSKYYHGLAGSPIKNIAIPPTANRSSSRSRSLGIRFCLAVGSWLIFRANWMMQWQNLSRAHITVQGFKSSELSSLKTTYLKPDCFAIPTLLWICLPMLFFLIVSPGGPPNWGPRVAWKRPSRFLKMNSTKSNPPRLMFLTCRTASCQKQIRSCCLSLYSVPPQAIKLMFVCILVK